MTNDWDRLAGAIRKRRQVLGMTQQQLADAAGVARTTIKNLEGARQPAARPPASLPAVENALGWTLGSARAILGGGEPAPIAGDGTPPTPGGEYDHEMDPDVGAIVRNTVFEVVGVLDPEMSLSRVREIEAIALEAVRRRGGIPRRRHNQASDNASKGSDNSE
jgi:transcriptional regulator with XRE-family HTH domain